MIMTISFPNFILSKSFGAKSLKFSYNRRIQRPSLRFINPYSNRVDRRNVSLGNPFLDPEISDVYEIGYNTFKRGTVITTSIYYRHTEDVIQPILQIGEDNLGVTTFENVATNDVIGGNVFTSFSIKKVTIRSNFDLSWLQTEGVTSSGEALKNNGLQYRIFGNASYNIGNGWKADTRGFFNSLALVFKDNGHLFQSLVSV